MLSEFDTDREIGQRGREREIFIEIILTKSQEEAVTRHDYNRKHYSVYLFEHRLQPKVFLPATGNACQALALINSRYCFRTFK